MTSVAFSFLVSCLVASVATPMVRRVALRLGLVETADNVLKIHEGGVPRVGGIALLLGFATPLLAILALGAGITTYFQADPRRMLAFGLGALAIFALGLWDDLRGLNAPVKLTVEIAIAIAAWSAGFRIDVLRLPFVGAVDLGPLGILVTILWIVGVTNALNLVDGMDGLAAGVAFFAASAHVVTGMLDGDPVLMLFGAALAGSVLGFLPYNFHPARIFMGDSGSLFLGYILAMASIYGVGHKSSTAVALLGPVLVLGLPILDTTLAVMRRAVKGVSLFDGDREHVHHRMLSLGLSQRRSVGLLYGLCAAFALAGLVTTASSSRATALVLVSLLVVLAVFERRLGFLRGNGPRATSHPAAEPIRELARMLARSDSSEQAWIALTEAAPGIGIKRLRLTRPGAAPLEWQGAWAARRESVFRARLRWPSSSGGPMGLLELEKRPFRRTAGLADELFVALLAEALRTGDAEPQSATERAASDSRD